MNSSEDLFIERINQKQRSAWHELFRRYYQALVMFAMKYVDKPEAEDIVQELFVSLWEKKENFLSYPSFCVFLYNSVRNTCLNRIKHQKVEEKFIHYSLSNEKDTEELDYEMMEEDLYRQLFQAVDELPVCCRKIFLMHLEGMKNEDIADCLKLSVQTVKTQKKRAMRYLRGRLGNFNFFVLCWGIDSFF